MLIRNNLFHFDKPDNFQNAQTSKLMKDLVYDFNDPYIPFFTPIGTKLFNNLENIFKKIWNGIVALWHRIVELFNNIKNFLTKKKMQDQFQDTDKKIKDITSSVSDDELDDILSSLGDIDIEESYILKEAEDSKGIYLYDLSEKSMAGAFMHNNAKEKLL